VSIFAIGVFGMNMDFRLLGDILPEEMMAVIESSEDTDKPVIAPDVADLVDVTKQVTGVESVNISNVPNASDFERSKDTEESVNASFNVSAVTEVLPQVLGVESVNSSHVLTQEPRVALYLTTHMSPRHVSFLENCWPSMFEQYPILKTVDLLLYTTRLPSDDMLSRLPFRSVLPHLYFNTGKQGGARQAMIDGHEKGWFKPYDWVIRMNPDVLFRGDATDWLWKKFRDENTRVIVNPIMARVCSDFYAFRPEVITDSALKASESIHNTELHLTSLLRNVTRANGRVLVKGPGLKGPGARTGSAHVLHHHAAVMNCPALPAAIDEV